MQVHRIAKQARRTVTPSLVLLILFSSKKFFCEAKGESSESGKRSVLNFGIFNDADFPVGERAMPRFFQNAGRLAVDPRTAKVSVAHS